VKQIYVESYYRNGYSRFMQYINDITGHPRHESIEKKVEIIKFFDDYGAEVIRRAFGKSRSTIYLWKLKLTKGGGKLSTLAPGDKTPLRKRKRLVHPFVENFIVEYRAAHPGVDKTTITPALTAACNAAGVRAVSESTVGRIICDLKAKGRIPRSNKVTFNGRTGTLLVRDPQT